jgi:transposase InsO family protein
MCEVLEISPKTYYKYRTRVHVDYQEYLLIKEVFEEGRETYGHRRIKKALLLKYGLKINRKKILRIMRIYGIQVRYKKVYETNYSRKYIDENICPNLIQRNFKASRENEKWCTDITCMSIGNRKAYLSTIMDLYTREIIAYEISLKNDNSLVVKNLIKAIEKRKNIIGVILHSDQGFQYTSYQYQAICKANGILISMSNKGNPIDNAAIESFHACLKRETLYSYKIKTLKEYIELVEEWIKFYNTTRIRTIKGVA